MSLEFETTVRVRYAETDQMGVVYHSNFFVWFEIGRVELIRSLGISYKQMEQEGDSHIVVVEAKCNYKKPALYDDVLRICTRILDSRTRLIRFGYEVFRDGSGELLATGETTHVFCDAQGRPKTLPENIRALIPLNSNDEGTPRA
jgi:acyl-CoA thioester hydrolase